MSGCLSRKRCKAYRAPLSYDRSSTQSEYVTVSIIAAWARVSSRSKRDLRVYSALLHRTNLPGHLVDHRRRRVGRAGRIRRVDERGDVVCAVVRGVAHGCEVGEDVRGGEVRG